MKTIKRSEILLADYNPRMIDEESRKRLKKGLKKFGMVQPLIYNERTKTLVSGHQRLSIIDEEAKGKDYEIEVAVIDVSEADEMKLNVQLNNTAMMGEFDEVLLQEMAEFIGDFEDFGFSDLENELIFNSEDVLDELKQKEEAAKTKGILNNIKSDRKEMVAEKKADNSANFYFVVVCQSEEEKEELYKKMGVPLSEEYIPSFKLIKLGNS